MKSPGLMGFPYNDDTKSKLFQHLRTLFNQTTFNTSSSIIEIPNLPQINSNFSENDSNDVLKEKLQLFLETRTNIIDYLFLNQKEIFISQDNKKFTAALLLQSFSCLFFENNLIYKNNIILQKFVKALNLSTKLIPEYRNLALDSLHLFFEKIKNNFEIIVLTLSVFVQLIKDKTLCRQFFLNVLCRSDFFEYFQNGFFPNIVSTDNKIENLSILFEFFCLSFSMINYCKCRNQKQNLKDFPTINWAKISENLLSNKLEIEEKTYKFILDILSLYPNLYHFPKKISLSNNQTLLNEPTSSSEKNQHTTDTFALDQEHVSNMFNGINNKDSACLIIPLIFSTKYSEFFLNSLYNYIVENNLVQVVKLFNFGVIKSLIDVIPFLLSTPNFYNNAKTFSLILNIVVFVMTFNCDRATEESFMKLFYQNLNTNQHLSSDDIDNRNYSIFLRSFKNMFFRNSMYSNNFIHFSYNNIIKTNNIISLPTFPYNYLNSGISFIVDLFIPYHFSKNSYLPLFSMFDKKDINYFIVLLKENSITFVSNLFNDGYSPSIDINIPKNEWMSLFINIKKFGEIIEIKLNEQQSIIYDQKLLPNHNSPNSSPTISSNSIFNSNKKHVNIQPWATPIERVEMLGFSKEIDYFKSNDEYNNGINKDEFVFEGLLRKVMIYKDNLTNDVISLNENSPHLIANFSPKFFNSNRGSIKNTANGNLGNALIVSSFLNIDHGNNDIQCSPFVNSFSDIFYSFDGIKELISYFCEIDSLNFVNKENLLYELFDCLLFLFSKFPKKTERAMKEFNGFQLIAHFLTPKIDLIGQSDVIFHCYDFIKDKKRFFNEIVKFEQSLENIIKSSNTNNDNHNINYVNMNRIRDESESIVDEFRDIFILNFLNFLDFFEPNQETPRKIDNNGSNTNNLPSSEDEMEELYAFIFKKWRTFEPLFLIKKVNFCKFCQIVYSQYYQLQASLRVRTELMCLLLIHANFFDTSDISLLIDLTSKIMKNDINSSLAIFQGIHVITVDHPEFLDTVYNGLIEMENKPPIVICTIVQLFEKDEHFIIKLLFKEITIQRSFSEKAEYVLYLCNSFVARKELSFSELIEVSRQTTVIAVQLLPFILALGFDCEKNVIDFISQFLTNLFSIKECVTFYVNSISSLTLFLLIAFGIFKSDTFLNCLLALISENMMFLADSLRIMDILADQQSFCCSNKYISSSLSNITDKFTTHEKFGIKINDLRNIQSLTINTFLLKIIDKQIDVQNGNDVNYLIKIIVNYICYGPNRSSIPLMRSYDAMNNQNLVFETLISCNSIRSNKTKHTNKHHDKVVTFDLIDFLTSFIDQQQRQINIGRRFESNNRHNSQQDSAFGISFRLVNKDNKKNDNDDDNLEISWQDEKTAEILMLFFDNDNISFESYELLFIIFSFLLNSNQIPIQKITEILQKISLKYSNCFNYISNQSNLYVYNYNSGLENENERDRILLPVFVKLHTVNKVIEILKERDFKTTNLTFNEKLFSFELTEENLCKFNQSMFRFWNSVQEISYIKNTLFEGLLNHKIISNSCNPNNPPKKECISSIDNIFSDLKQRELTNRVLNEKMYRKLKLDDQLFLGYNFDKSNSCNTSNTNKNCFFRRYNLYDVHFRPFILTNTSEHVKFITINSQIMNLNDKVKTGYVFWTSKCQRIKINERIEGYFSVTEKGFLFETTKGKSQLLRKGSIRYIFWNFTEDNEPLSFSFFILKGKSYLFRFYEPETRESIIENLSQIELNNCIFFQKNIGQKELEKLGLTKKWRERRLSNYDYIMWLNLLSGRTYLNANFYPIFPLIFSSNDEKTILRSLSKNVMFLCNESVSKWKEVRDSLDPYESFVFNQTSSTENIVKMLLKNIDQFNHVIIQQNHEQDKIEEGECENSKTTIHLKSKSYSKFDIIYEMDSKNKVVENSIISASYSNDNLENLKNGNYSEKLVLDDINSFSDFLVSIKNGSMHSELVPEFFFLPEAFKNWKSFPNWANSPSLLVLSHASMLESEEVSLKIHSWIDQIFGVQQNNNMYNPDLSISSNIYKHTSKSMSSSKSVSDINHRNNPWYLLGCRNIVVDHKEENFHSKLKGHLPLQLFVGPHPARSYVPTFVADTSSIIFRDCKYISNEKSAKSNNRTTNNDAVVNNSTGVLENFGQRVNYKDNNQIQNNENNQNENNQNENNQNENNQNENNQNENNQNENNQNENNQNENNQNDNNQNDNNQNDNNQNDNQIEDGTLKSNMNENVCYNIINNDNDCGNQEMNSEYFLPRPVSIGVINSAKKEFLILTEDDTLTHLPNKETLKIFEGNKEKFYFNSNITNIYKGTLYYVPLGTKIIHFCEFDKNRQNYNYNNDNTSTNNSHLGNPTLYLKKTLSSIMQSFENFNSYPDGGDTSNMANSDTNNINSINPNIKRNSNSNQYNNNNSNNDSNNTNNENNNNINNNNNSESNNNNTGENNGSSNNLNDESRRNSLNERYFSDENESDDFWKDSPHLLPINCIDSTHKFVVSGSEDSSIAVWVKGDTYMTPFKTLLVHRKPIKILKIVERMRILLSCDIDGNIAMSVFPYLKLIKIINRANSGNIQNNNNINTLSILQKGNIFYCDDDQCQISNKNDIRCDQLNNDYNQTNNNNDQMINYNDQMNNINSSEPSNAFRSTSCLSFVPKFLDMTQNCVVAFSDTVVCCLTANGEKIMERDFSSMFSAIVAEVAVEVVTRNDVIAIATSNNEVLLMSCASLEVVGVLATLATKVSLMKFDESSDSVIIVTAGNEVVVVRVPD